MNIHNTKTTRGLKSAALSLALFASATAFAQDSAPQPKKTYAPQLSREQAKIEGTIEAIAHVNKYGYVTHTEIASATDSDVGAAISAALRRWVFEPAKKDGVAIDSRVKQPFNFDQGSISIARTEKKDTNPSPTHRASPALPEDLSNITGRVTLRASIGADGKVIGAAIDETTHEELNPYAIEAIHQWKFKPAVRDGSTIASTVIVPFHFSGTGSQKIVTAAREAKQVDRMAQPIRRLDPVLPENMQDVAANANLMIYVDTNGYVAKAEVVDSNNAQLSQSAIDAVLQWKFRPAVKDGQKVESKLLQPFVFNGGVLVAKEQPDRIPSIKKALDPQLPQGLQGVGGYVHVLFELDEQGSVVRASARKSSHEEFEGPTLEAAQNWKFRPAVKDGHAVSSSVVVPINFGKQNG